MPNLKIDAQRDGEPCGSEYCQFSFESVDPDPQRWNDRRRNTEIVEGNFVLVFAFVTVQQTSRDFSVQLWIVAR